MIPASGDVRGAERLIDDFESPSEHALISDALPLDADVRRLIIAIQRIGAAPADSGAINQQLVELAQWVIQCDGAALEQVDGAGLVNTHACGMLADSVGSRQRRERSLSGLALATGQPQLSVDAMRDARVERSVSKRLGIGSLIVSPLRHAHDTTTVLTVATRDPNGCTERDVALLQPLIHIASTRLGRVAHFDEQHAADQLLVTIGEASRDILVADEPATVLCEWAGRLVDAPFAGFLQPDDDGNLVTVAQTGAPVAPMCLEPGKGSIIRGAFDTGRLQLVADYRNHPDVSLRIVETLDAAGLNDTHSGAALPVEVGGQPIGVLVLIIRERMTAAHAPLLGLVNVLATEAGLAIERDKLQRQLEAQARTDDLTGLANRRVWHERLGLETARATRNRAPLSLAILDLDHFKDFNDAHGHQAGDDILCATAKAWARHVRDTDLLARLGGEEFALLLPDTSAEAGVAIGERLLAALPGGITASAGLAQWQGEDADALYRRADEALYAAKAAGRNQLKTAVNDTE